MSTDRVAALADRIARAVDGDGHVAAAYGGAAPAVDIEAPAARPAQWVPFPVTALPEPFASYVADSARARQCDPAAVAVPLLAALAGAIGTARTVRLWPDWYAPSVLWVAVVASSGAVKSPGFEAGVDPLEVVERRARDAWHPQHEEFRCQQKLYEAEFAAWKRKKVPRGDPPEEPDEPTLPRCIVDDTTMQAVGDLLLANHRGVLLARDELSGWVRSFDQFTGAAGADVARWLEIYRARPLRIDRKVGGHTYVPRAAVSICGTIQTDILPRVFSAEHQANGLLARFLLVAPPEPERQWDRGRHARAPDVAKLVKRFSALRALDMAADGEPPQALGLSPEAGERYGAWFGAHDQRRRNTEPGSWRSALAKIEELPARLGLVLALARAEVPGQVKAVDDDTMRRAIKLSDWFRPEGERVYALLAETPEARADRELVEWVQAHPAASAREVAQGMWRYRGPGGTDRAEADLRRLADDGRLEVSERRGRRGPSVACYRVSAQSPPSSTSTGNGNPQRDSEKRVDVEAAEGARNVWETEL